MSKPYRVSVYCPGCLRRWVYRGLLAERPACPHCGHRPPQDKLDASQAAVDHLQADPEFQAAVRRLRREHTPRVQSEGRPSKEP